MNRTKRLPYKRAICYSGFRDGQSPDAGVFPSESEILEDLRLLEGHWDALRVYACDLHTERVLKVIERENLPFTVMLGAYIGAEVNNLIARGAVFTVMRHFKRIASTTSRSWIVL